MLLFLPIPYVYTSSNSTMCPIPPLGTSIQYQMYQLVYGDFVPLERVNKSYRFSIQGHPIPAAVNVTRMLLHSTMSRSSLQAGVYTGRPVTWDNSSSFS